MKNKLTAEEITKVFAMYLGAEFLYESNEPEIVCGVHEGIVYDEHLDDSGEGIYSMDECKLLLTPLSKITDEHAFNLATRTDYNRTYWKEKPDFNVAVIEDRGFTIGNKANAASFFWHSLHWRQYQYLIDEGYAVPLWFGLNHWANGKTAIELGIAIDKTIQ